MIYNIKENMSVSFSNNFLERSKGSVAKQYTSLTFDISQLDITQYVHIENTSVLAAFTNNFVL